MTRMTFVLVCLAVMFGAAAVPNAYADPAPPWSDPRYPDQTHGMCAGGHGGAFGFGWCDGEHYPDGSYWHQVIGTGMDGLRPQCMLNNEPAPPGGCGGYASAPAP